MIITISGSGSGAGKSATARELAKDSRFCFVISHTTRQPKSDDAAGEYSYISEEEFEKMKSEFVWTAPPFRGRNYGTTKKALDEAISDKSGKIFIMILVPETIPLLVKNLPGQD